MAHAEVVLAAGGTLHVSGDAFRGTTEHRIVLLGKLDKHSGLYFHSL